MAKYVIAGKSDCPFYARAELVADELALKLPNLSVHKIVLNPSEWDDWLASTCKEKEWEYKGGSPIVWRELINRGGKGVLLGSCNDFLEIATGYYGLTCNKATEEMKAISSENKATKDTVDEEERCRLAASKPFRITITCADFGLAYNILPLICNGDVLKEYEEITFFLHCNSTDTKNEADLADKTDALVMELQDCAQNQLKNVAIIHCITDESVEQSNLVIFLNFTRDMNEEFLIHLKDYAIALNESVQDTTKVLIAGENAVTCCHIISKFTPDIPRDNLIAMTRFQENKVKAAVSKELQINSAGINNLIVWGSDKEFIVDYNISTAHGYNGSIWAPHIQTFSHSVKEMIFNKKVLNFGLAEQLNKQECKITERALSFSAAFIGQLKDLMSSSDGNESIFSCAMISNGWYDVPKGLSYSFPVRYTSGGIEVVKNLELTEKVKDEIKRTSQELEEYYRGLLSSIGFNEAVPIESNEEIQGGKIEDEENEK